MKELAAENGEFCFADNKLRGAAVKRVAEDRMFEGGEVHTNLMRASGVELDFDERGGTKLLEDGPVGAGIAGVCGFAGRPGGHSYAALGIAGDGKFDGAFCSGEFSLDEREIGFLNGTRAKGFGKFGVREIVFGDEDCAARIFVEAMNDSRAQRVAALRERLATAEKRVDERAARVPCSGVNGHASGFVDDDELVVLIKNIERDGFGFGFKRWTRLGLNGDALAAFEFLAGFGGLAVDLDEAGIDEFLDA